MTSNIERLAERLSPEVSVRTVVYRGRKYAVTQGSGERSYGRDGGGQAAFAYAASSLRAADLCSEDFDYSHWCQSTSTVADRGLARKLAREYGLRLTVGGACTPVLSDADFARYAEHRGRKVQCVACERGYVVGAFWPSELVPLEVQP